MNMFSLWQSDKLVLRMYGAEEVDEHTGGEYYTIVRDLAQRAQLPMPRVYIMNNPQPNAFATGRNPQNAAVCASTGLIEMLSPEEVAGVMAHELAHVKNYDTLTMAVAATIGGAVSMLAQFLQFGALFGGNRGNNNPLGWIGVLVAIIVAPLAAMLVQMAVSRSREYQADRLGGLICGNPLSLASALRKIEHYARGIPNEQAEAAPARRTCSSSTRSPARAWTTCSRPTPTPTTASPSWRSWRPRWAPRLAPAPPSPAASAGPWGAALPPAARPLGVSRCQALLADTSPRPAFGPRCRPRGSDTGSAAIIPHQRESYGVRPAGPDPFFRSIRVSTNNSARRTGPSRREVALMGLASGGRREQAAEASAAPGRRSRPHRSRSSRARRCSATRTGRPCS